MPPYDIKAGSLKDLDPTQRYYEVLEVFSMTGRNPVLIRRWLNEGRIQAFLTVEGKHRKWWITPKGLLQIMEQPRRKKS